MAERDKQFGGGRKKWWFSSFAQLPHTNTTSNFDTKKLVRIFRRLLKQKQAEGLISRFPHPDFQEQ